MRRVICNVETAPLPLPCSLFLSQDSSFPVGKSLSGYETSIRAWFSMPRRGPSTARRGLPAALYRVSSGHGKQGHRAAKGALEEGVCPKLD